MDAHRIAAIDVHCAHSTPHPRGDLIEEKVITAVSGSVRNWLLASLARLGGFTRKRWKRTRVETETTVNLVDTRATGDRVGAAIATKVIGASAARNGVIRCTTDDLVSTAATKDDVMTLATVYGVVAGTAIDLIGSTDADDRVVSSVAVQHVGTSVSGDLIVTRTTVDDVESLTATDDVVTQATFDSVGATTGVDRVVTVTTIDRVEADATVDDVIAAEAADGVSSRATRDEVVALGTDDDVVANGWELSSTDVDGDREALATEASLATNAWSCVQS